MMETDSAKHWVVPGINLTSTVRYLVVDLSYVPYSGKVWRRESLANLANRRRFAKLKPSKLITTIDNPLADLFIRQTFFRQTLKNSRFAKHYARQTFPLYGIQIVKVTCIC